MNATQNALEIHGNTYAHREALKRLGCRWSAPRKCWIAPNHEVAEQARKLVPATKCGGRRSGPRCCATCGSRINYGVYCGKCEYGR